MVATGWSRYTTFMTPCEGLEASLHSLVLAGAVMWDAAIPEDAEAVAVRFLSTGGRKRLAGERFARCLAASREFADWGTYLQGLVQRARSFPHVAGDAGRFDHRHWKDFCLGWKKHLDRGERIAREWKKAHAGLVPGVWLERCARSRTWPPQVVHDSLRRELERRLPGTGDM